MSNVKYLSSIAGLAAFFIVGLPLAAQYTTATLDGTVVDQTGSSIPGAKVTIENEATGLSRSSSTASDGTFLFSALPAGTYRLTTTKEGFTTSVQSDIALEVNQTVSQRVRLKLGTTSTEVTVAANADLVTTRSAQVSQVVNNRAILALPLNGREPQQLVFLTAGAVNGTSQYPGVHSQGGTYPGEQEALVQGSGPGTVNYQLDGGDYNDPYLNTNLPFPNPDAIQEFGVNTDNLSAEYGNSASAVVSIVTKSGSNDIHGSLFEFVRNGDLNARNFFAPTHDALKRNQFGGTVGGPILKNKLFYFGTIQATRIRSTAQGEVAFVPTAAERSGDFSAVSKQLVDPVTGGQLVGNQIPSNRLSPVSQYFLQRMPLPNGPGGQLTFGGPNVVQNDLQWMPKIDYEVGKNHLTGRYFWTRFSEPPGMAAANKNILATDPNGNLVTINNLAVNDTYVASPTLLFNTWFGYDRQTGGSLSGAPFSLPDAGMNVASPTPPELDVQAGGYFHISTNHEGIFNRSDWNLREVATWMKGAHELVFGGEFLRINNYINNTYLMAGRVRFNGNLSGNNLADFIMGQASQFIQGGGEFKNMAGSVPSLFIQDNYRVNARLTLSGGVRWDPYLPYQETSGRVVCFQPGAQSTRFPNAPLGMLFGGGAHDQGCPPAGSYNQWSDFAPRFGFAYKLTSDGKTSIRGGAGIYYIPPMMTQFNAFADTAPFAPRFTLTDVNVSDPFGSAGMVNPFPDQYGPGIPSRDVGFTLPVSIRWFFPLDFQKSQLATWNLTVERQLGKSWLLRAAYVGNKGTYLSNGFKGNREVNPAIYIPGGSTEANTQSRRIYQDFSSIGEYSSDNNSHYDGLELSVEKRLSHGLHLLANYTWSKMMDDYGWTDPFYRGFDYGISDDNVPQVFKLSASWNLPRTDFQGVAGQVVNGWELTGLTSWHSGFPFSIYSGMDNSFTDVGRDRADFIGTSLSQAALDPTRPHGELIGQYFDTSLFVPNAVGTFGNTAKNIFQAPGFFNMDVALLKNFEIRERAKIQFRAEFFNALNSVNFSAPGSTVGTSSFGKISSASDPRILQFALKFAF